MIDLNSSRNFRSEISLSFMGDVFKLAEWWPSVTFSYVGTCVCFRWLVEVVEVQDWRWGWMALDVEFSCFRCCFVSWRFSYILCMPCSWLGVPLEKGCILLVDLVILCKRKRCDFLHIWHIWLDMRSMSVCDHSFGSFCIGILVVFYRALLFLLLYAK